MSLQIKLWDVSSSLTGSHTSNFSLSTSLSLPQDWAAESAVSSSRGSHASWNLWWVFQLVFLYLCPPAHGPSVCSLPSTPCLRSLSIPPWLLPCVRTGCIAATEANQRNFVSAIAEKVHDGFFCPHFQLCPKVQAPGAVMSAVSACSTGVEKGLNYTDRVFGWVIQRHSMWEWSLRFLPFTFPFLFSKQNTIWASPSLDQNSGACPAYFYSKKKTHCFCTLPPLPMAGLLHRNIPQFSEFINLFFRGNEWRYSQLLNSRRNPLNFSVAILSGGCSFSRDISGGSAPTPNLFGFSKRRCHWGIRVSSPGSKV